MPVTASIILDSGSFLTSNAGLGYDTCKVGCFQCDLSCPDVRIYADGEEVDLNANLKLGRNSGMIEVVHLRRDGTKETGVTKSGNIDKYLLKRAELYGGEKVRVDESKFDYILLFHSGSFRSSMVKPRRFKEIDSHGNLTSTNPKELKPIAHDVVASYNLADGDQLQLVRDGRLLWSSGTVKNLRDRLDIEILADDDTALKYYRWSLAQRNLYWIPNQGHPPPVMCPPANP